MAHVMNQPASSSTLAAVAGRAAKALREAADARDAYDPETAMPCATAPHVTLLVEALAMLDVFMAAVASRSFEDGSFRKPPHSTMLDHWCAITLGRYDAGQIRDAASDCEAWKKRYLDEM